MAQPRQLFVAADGPRVDRDGEAQLCEESRRIIDKVDWPCEVKTLFREQNLGCREAVGGAISWFFENVEEGIILEDDCLPNESFFTFCAELLERYRHDHRVMCITGDNFQNGQKSGSASYYFSIYNHIWGWATWRRAWNHFDHNLSKWETLRRTFFLNKLMPRESVAYWTRVFDSVRNREVNSWAYIWTFSCWARGGLTATPNVNLISNIGFDSRATHTVDHASRLANPPISELTFPQTHPLRVRRDKKADSFVERNVFGIQFTESYAVRARRKLNRIIQKINKLACRS